MDEIKDQDLIIFMMGQKDIKIIYEPYSIKKWRASGEVIYLVGPDVLFGYGDTPTEALKDLYKQAATIDSVMNARKKAMTEAGLVETDQEEWRVKRNKVKIKEEGEQHAT